MSTPLSKDPDATLDYGWNWGPWLDGDTLTDSTWEIEDPTEPPASAAIESESFTAGGITTVWVSGGVAGTRIKLTNRIVTAGGRTDDRTISIQIREK